MFALVGDVLCYRSEKIKRIEDLIVSVHALSKVHFLTQHGIARALGVAGAIHDFIVIRECDHPRQ